MKSYQPSKPWKPRRPPAIKTLFFRAGVSLPLDRKGVRKAAVIDYLPNTNKFELEHSADGK